MALFRKKPVEIEAFQWNGKRSDIAPLLSERCDIMEPGDGTLRICTLEGEMTAQLGDWIIRGVKGEVYPCKPDIFEETYDRVGLRVDEVAEKVRRITQEVEQHAQDRKVLCIRSKAPWTPPEAAVEVSEASVVDPKEPVLDRDAIDLLEHTLNTARKGGVRGCIVLTGMPTVEAEPDLVTDIRCEISYSAAENPQIFLGGIETAKHDLLSFADEVTDISEFDEFDEEDGYED